MQLRGAFMALLNQATQVYSQLPKFFETLRAGTAPSTFTRQFLKDIDYKSSNHHAFIPLLKGLGFLTSDGTPTDRYRQFLDGSRWQKILAEAVREAYGDIFVLKAKPTNADLQMIAGKYKSTYNLSDTQAERSARTFLALLALCDPDTLYGSAKPSQSEAEQPDQTPIFAPISSTAPAEKNGNGYPSVKPPVGLHYNVQIHLPATKDVEVYNAIFKSLREHLID
jgi:Family of unknown function (DUF5343)